jgi:hypothetical protein
MENGEGRKGLIRNAERGELGRRMVRGEFLYVWTPFNKLGRIYGKEINERVKKSPIFLLKNPGNGVPS